MNKKNVVVNSDKTVQCYIELANNPCVIKLTPTEITDIDAVREILDSTDPNKKIHYISRNDFYHFCLKISGNEIFRGYTIINPKKEEMNKVIFVNDKLQASIMPMDDDDLDEILYTKKKLGDGLTNKPYFIAYLEL